MSIAMPTIDRQLLLALGGVAALALLSLSIGVYHLSFATLRSGEDLHATMVLMASRVPRTLAIILVGVSMGIAGLIMQLLSRNRFVSPSTAGTVESASLGILAVTIVAPDTPMIGKMAVATVFALAGTALFLALLRAVPLRSPLVVPLIGLMLGSVISSITTFFAYRHDFLQSLSAWTGGDFSRVLRGRYELLWLSGVLTVVAFIVADRFTVAGLGEAFTTNLGLNYRRVLALGLTIVAVVTAVNVVTVGAIPFLGLIVPNVVSMVKGDNVRRSSPWVAVFGAGFLLVCDIFGRLIRYPFEVPIGTVVGVVGSVVFLVMLLRSSDRVS
jgi:iron complex transport system permease protein